MTGQFDPYHKWLAIPPEDQPPDHYRLLGLKQFESDPEVIDYAAEQRTRHVRAFQAGKHSEVSQRILNEIAAARVCLLNPEKKRSYDESLRRKPGADADPAARASAAPSVSPAVVRVLQPLVAESSVGSRYRSRKSGQNKTAIVGAGAAMILIVAAFGLWRGLAGSPGKPAASGPASVAAGQRTGTPDAEPVKPDPLPAASGSPTTISPDAELPSQPAMPAQPPGTQPPELPPPQTASALEPAPPAQPPAPAAPPEPAGKVLADGGHSAWVGAAPGNNVYMFETAEPVRLDRTGIRFHSTSGASQGRLELSLDGETWVPFGRWTPETCDKAQREFAAWQWAPLRDPSEAKRIHVRFVWERHEGITVRGALWVADAGPADGATVVAVANPAGGESGASAAGASEMPPQVAQGTPAVGSQPAPVEGPPTADPPQPPPQPKRHPLPAKEKQQEIGQQIDEVYKPAARKTPAEKLKLAQDFLLQGQKADGNLEERFVFLQRAMDLACETHDAVLVMAAVTSIGNDFEVDTLDAKVKMLTKVSRGADDEASIPSLVVAAGQVIDEALAADQLEAAGTIADLVSRACQAPAGRKFRKEVQQRRLKVQTAKTLGERFQQARAALEKEPDNAEALLAVGRWHWLAKGDWDQAARFLTRGSDAELKTLAARELNERPSQPEQQVQLGDAWWALAETREGDERDAMLRRAGLWYRQAVAGLTGLAKTRVEQRLATISAAEIASGEAAAGPKAAAKGATKVAAKAPLKKEAAGPGGDLRRSAGTVIPDRIEAELRLDKAHGPYKLLGVTTVARGSKLLFERGAAVLCAPGAKIVVEGDLASYGDTDEFVAFRAGVAGGPWNGIVAPNYHRRIVLERFDVGGANCGADLGRGDLLVKDCVFAQNRVGIKLQSEHNQKLENCLIANNLADGLCLWLWRMSIDRCTIANNGGAGLFLEYEGWPKITNSVIAGNAVGIKSKLYETKPEIHSSNIVGNRLAVEIHTKEDFQCENNYWGTDNPQQILANFADGRQKPGRGVVRFEPFEPKPIAGAGCTLQLPRER